MKTPGYIDIEVTVWQRLTLPDEMTEEQVKEIYDCALNSKSLPDWVYDHPDFQLEHLSETEQVNYKWIDLLDERKRMFLSVKDGFVEHDENEYLNPPTPSL